VKYGFALPSFYTSASVLRLFLDGDATDTDIINEFRIQKTFFGDRSEHRVSAGAYLSRMNLLPTTYSYLHLSTTDPNDIRALGFGPPGTPPPSTGSITRRGDYDEDVLSFFIGDEMKLNNKWTINLGARWDRINLDMSETKRPFDSTLTRQESFSDWSASIGANYLFSPRSALYGNVTRAFRMPDYSAFTSLEFVPGTRRLLRLPDGLDRNEVILNTELGYRTGIGDLGVDIAAFFTNIDNRLASIFEDGLLVSKPLGQNQILGSELSLTYAPQAVRGLLLRTSLTAQRAEFADFSIPVGRNAQGQLNVDPNGNLYGNTLTREGENLYSIDLKGNKIPGVPAFIWNFLASYSHKYFGIDFSSNINTNRYADATNIIELGTLSILNLGGYVRLPLRGGNDIQLGAQAKNLLNDMAIQGIAGVADNDTVLSTKQRNPNFTGLLGHGYVQLPRRILFTLSYNF
jgi:outer membrane receptor protein involved in Fe transport